MGMSSNTADASNQSINLSQDPGAITIPANAANDGFVVGDLIFSDVLNSSYINLNGCIPALALATGAGSQVLYQPAATTTNSTTATGARLKLDDGSGYIVAMAANNAVAGLWAVEVRRFDTQGKVIADIVLELRTGIGSSVVAPTNFCLTQLANGMLVLSDTGTDGAGSGSALWVMSPLLNVLYSTFTAAPINWLQELPNSKLAAFTTVSVIIIDCATTGFTTTTPITGLGDITYQTGAAAYDHAADYNRRGANGNAALAPISISSGGFGVICRLGTSGPNWVYNYARINSDGTVRGSTVQLASFINHAVGTVTWARAPQSGNICWAERTTGSGDLGYYGVVSDSGTILKASTQLPAGMATIQQDINITVDSGGSFLISTLDYTSWVCKGLYVDAAGVTKSGWPKTLYSVAGAGGDFVAFYTLSTMIVVLYSATVSNTNARVAYNTILLDGTVGTSKSFGPIQSATSGNATPYSAAAVKNDKIYGVATSKSSGGAPAWGLFSIDSTGVCLASGTSVSTAAMGSDVAARPRVVFEPNGQNFLAILTGYLVVCSLTLEQRSSVQNSLLQGSFTRYFIDAYALHGFQCYGPTASSSPGAGGCAFSIKYKPTTLVGVCSTAGAAGAQFSGKTKGVYNTTFVGSQTFDQSAASPPGNVGSVNSGLVILKGLAA